MNHPIPILGFADPVSSWTHLLATGAALVGTVPLCRRGRGNVGRIVALMVFSVSLMFLFSMSGVFHLLDRDGEARGVLQRLDHAGIWALIAGTFTPIHTILFRGPWRWAILSLVWILAITGLVLEVVFFTSFPESLLLGLFLGLGWIGAVSGVKFTRLYRDRSVWYLAGGGIFYSIGAVIDFLNWPSLVDGIVGPHEIFHLFVIFGALAHWLFIYEWSAHPVGNSLTIHVRIFPDRRVIAHAVGESFDLEAESVESLKRKIRDQVALRFHRTYQPMILLRYFEEEHFY